MQAWHTLTAHCLHEEAGLAKHVHLGGCLSGVRVQPGRLPCKQLAKAVNIPEFIGCRFDGPPIAARLYLTNSAKRN